MIQDNENRPDDKEDDEDEVKEAKNSEKVTIEFPFSEILRAQAPKAFAVAEKVATDWKNEGKFTDIGLPHPIADAVASQALQKAKEIEKKLEEKGVFTLAKMGLEIAKSQVAQFTKPAPAKSTGSKKADDDV
jgi:hypothetical protein